MSIFPNVRGDQDGGRFTAQFWEALEGASPQEMAEQVLSACQFIESFRRSPENENRFNNATYAICQVTQVLAGRVASAQQAQDDRVHAETRKILELCMDALINHGPQVLQGLLLAVKEIDPYEYRGDKLYRKSDGVLVDWLDDEKEDKS